MSKENDVRYKRILRRFCLMTNANYAQCLQVFRDMEPAIRHEKVMECAVFCAQKEQAQREKRAYEVKREREKSQKIQEEKAKRLREARDRNGKDSIFTESDHAVAAVIRRKSDEGEGAADPI